MRVLILIVALYLCGGRPVMDVPTAILMVCERGTGGHHALRRTRGWQGRCQWRGGAWLTRLHLGRLHDGWSSAQRRRGGATMGRRCDRWWRRVTTSALGWGATRRSASWRRPSGIGQSVAQCRPPRCHRRGGKAHGLTRSAFLASTAREKIERRAGSRGMPIDTPLTRAPSGRHANKRRV